MWFPFASSRAPEARSLENPSSSLLEALIGAPSATGEYVTPEKAVRVPDVYACVQVLAQDVGRCPLKLRVHNGPGQSLDATEHDLWAILHDLPNPETTAYEFRRQMTQDVLTYERAYARIERINGRIWSLWRLDPTKMEIRRDGLNRKVYVYRLPGGDVQTWTFDASMPPVLELVHPSPLGSCRDLIAVAMALEKYAAKFFQNGARMSGVLQTEKILGDAGRKNLRESFAALYGGVDNAHKVAVLEHGLEYKPITQSNDEAQLMEVRRFVRSQIAGTFRVPAHKIGDLERATFSNIEHQSIEYVTGGGLDPYLTLWEQAIRRDLLTTRQFDRYYAEFDREKLIRGDLQSTLAAYATARQNGIYSSNDIRRKLGENPISKADGGDEYLVNGTMIPIGDAGKDTQPAPAEPAQVM